MPKTSDKFQKPIRADVLVVRLEAPDGQRVDVDLRKGFTSEENTEPKREKITHE